MHCTVTTVLLYYCSALLSYSNAAPLCRQPRPRHSFLFLPDKHVQDNERGMTVVCSSLLKSSIETNSLKMSDYGSAEDIAKKIDKNIYTTETKDASRNNVWNHFFGISAVIDDERQVIPYVQCIKCKRVLSYDSMKGGTSHLRRHADSCNAGASASSPSIANFFKLTSVSNAAKQKITEQCVQFVCRDIRPFQTVAGDGFMALADALIMIGVKYGQVAASEILPNPTTISRNIEAKYADIKENVVIPELLKYVNVYGGSVTTDMWTEQFTQTSYITLTVHYVNDDWKLVCRTLSTSEFDNDLRHTGVNIRKTIGEILSSFEIDSNKVVFVTDRGSNMLSALKNDTHLSCCDHMLNTVLTHLFDSKNLDSLPELSALMTASKDLVRYFKKAEAGSADEMVQHAHYAAIYSGQF